MWNGAKYENNGITKHNTTGNCGIPIRNAENSDNGSWTCNVAVEEKMDLWHTRKQ